MWYYVHWILGCKCSEDYPPNVLYVQNLGGYSVRADYQVNVLF